jgi:hypothetical protein
MSPRRRDPYRACHELHGRREQIVDDHDHSARAVEHGRSRGAVIEHEAVVSVVHLEQRGACKPYAITVLHDSTTCDAQVTAGIGEAHNGLVRDERLHPKLKALGTGKRGLQFGHGDLVSEGTRETPDASGNRVLGLPFPDLDRFQFWFERCMAAATCSAVAIDIGERNQPVPLIPSTSGFASLSLSSRCRMMLTVE